MKKKTATAAAVRTTALDRLKQAAECKENVFPALLEVAHSAGARRRSNKHPLADVLGFQEPR